MALLAEYGDLTCLHLAALRGHVEVVKELLATKLELINIKDKRGVSALCFAVEYGHDEIVTLLVESVKAIRGHPYGKDLLRCAIEAGYDHIAIQLFVECPHLVAETFDDGKGPLHLAATLSRDAVVAQVFAQRPRLAAVGGNYGSILLHCAAQYGYDTVVAELLVENPDLIDVVDGSVLHVAVDNGHDKVVAHLLAAKPALASHKDSEGQTALHRAASRWHDKVVALLLAQSSELIDVKDKANRTALSSAIGSSIRVRSGGGGYVETVACLLAHRPAEVGFTMLWETLTESCDVAEDEVARLLLAYKPLLVGGTAKNGEPIIHCVFDLGYKDRRRYFREELTRVVYGMSPPKAALCTINHGNADPLYVAIFALELVQGKLSLDEIMEAFSKCEKVCPEAPFDTHGGYLLELLHKEVAGIVCEYLGDQPKEREKQRLAQRKWKEFHVMRKRGIEMEKLFDQIRECLLDSLNRDVAGTVCEYLGIEDGKRTNNKRRRNRESKNNQHRQCCWKSRWKSGRKLEFQAEISEIQFEL